MLLYKKKLLLMTFGTALVLNPYPANVDNMASSYQCLQMADGI